MNEQQISICAHAHLAEHYGSAISVDPELESDAQELVENGWLRSAEGEEGEVGYAITLAGRVAMLAAAEN